MKNQINRVHFNIKINGCFLLSFMLTGYCHVHWYFFILYEEQRVMVSLFKQVYNRENAIFASKC